MKNPERALVSICIGALAVLAFLLLAGCAGRDKIHNVPTPVACVKSDAIPTEPERVSGKLTGEASEDVAVLAVSNLDLRDWGGKLRALLRGCE